MYYVTKVYEFIAVASQLARCLFNDVVDVFIFILQIFNIQFVRIVVPVDGLLLLLGRLGGGRRKVHRPERLHPCDPLQHLLLAPAML